jgi:hypothetical protein
VPTVGAWTRCGADRQPRLYYRAYRALRVSSGARGVETTAPLRKHVDRSGSAIRPSGTVQRRRDTRPGAPLRP